MTAYVFYYAGLFYNDEWSFYLIFTCFTVCTKNII